MKLESHGAETSWHGRGREDGLEAFGRGHVRHFPARIL